MLVSINFFKGNFNGKNCFKKVIRKLHLGLLSDKENTDGGTSGKVIIPTALI